MINKFFSELFDDFKTVEDKNKYYFNNNATTLIYDKEVIKEVDKWLNCANPSNTLHYKGLEAHKQLEKSRNIIANDLQVKPNELFFTGSATEANNIIIQSIVNKKINEMKNSNNGFRKKCTIITTVFEHPSVLNVFNQYLNNIYVDVVFIPVELNYKSEYYGSINPLTLKSILKTSVNPVLVSIMYANNETGAINDIKELSKIIKQFNKDLFFHCDATQAIGKFKIHPNNLNVDALTFSGHKFHAPKGIGCLFIKNINNKCPINCGICFGGEQELSIRPGTENVAFISGLALALKKVHEDRDYKNEELQTKKNYIIKKLKDLNCKFILPKKSLNNTIMVVLPNLSICNKKVCNILSSKFSICIGISSACQTSKISHVLKAMNVKEKDVLKILRISLCDYNTNEECVYLVQALKMIIDKYKIY